MWIERAMELCFCLGPLSFETAGTLHNPSAASACLHVFWKDLVDPGGFQSEFQSRRGYATLNP